MDNGIGNVLSVHFEKEHRGNDTETTRRQGPTGDGRRWVTGAYTVACTAVRACAASSTSESADPAAYPVSSDSARFRLSPFLAGRRRALVCGLRARLVSSQGQSAQVERRIGRTKSKEMMNA